VRSLITPATTITQATPRTRIIVADLGTQAFEFRAGQAVTVGLAEGNLRRPYSIACSPQQASRNRALELLVQIDDHAAPDPHLERAAAGTLLRIDGPFGSFCLPSPLLEQRVLLVAGGTGIAPLRSIMWDVLERDPGVAVSVAYSARTPEELAYLEELRRLEQDARITLAITVTREPGHAWSGATGRIDRSLIARVLTSVDTRCLVCGPTGFVSEVAALIEAAGVAKERIVKETYDGDVPAHIPTM
jgi:propane monooxygenase reductase subunit